MEAWAAFHQRKEGLGEERVGTCGDIHGGEERFTGEAFQEVTGDRFAGSVADRMNEAVKTTPLFLDSLHSTFDMFILRDIERQNEVAAEFLSKLADAVPSVIASIREGEFSTFAVADLRNAVRDGMVGQNSGDENFFAVEKSHSVFLRF